MNYWLALEPFRHARWELAILRVVLALLFWDIHTAWIGFWREPSRAVVQAFSPSLRLDNKYEAMPHPNGVGMFLDLTVLSDDKVERPLCAATGVSLILFVLGVPAAFSLALPVVFGLGVTTLINSQGAIGHNAQALHLVLLVMWLAGVWSQACRATGRPLPHGFTPGELGLDWARQALMAGYVVSGLTKLASTDGGWLSATRYFPLHVMKNNDMEFYDTLNPAALKLDWLPQVMMDHPNLCIFFFGLAIPLELFAFLGLRNRRIALLFGLGLLVFHQSVTELTHLAFLFHKLLLFFLFVSPQWWLVEGIKKITRRPQQPAAGT